MSEIKDEGYLLSSWLLGNKFRRAPSFIIIKFISYHCVPFSREFEKPIICKQKMTMEPFIVKVKDLIGLSFR